MEETTVRVCSMEGHVTEDAAAAVPAAMQVERSVHDGKAEHAADAAPAAPAAEAAATDTDTTDGRNQEAGEGLRLSQSIVNCILGMKPEVVEDADEYYARMTSDPAKKRLFSQEFIESHTAMLRNLAETSKRVFAEFVEFQAWARAEYEAKGYVEVDDDYIAQRVELFEGMDEEEVDDLEGLVYADE